MTTVTDFSWENRKNFNGFIPILLINSSSAGLAGIVVALNRLLLLLIR